MRKCLSVTEGAVVLSGEVLNYPEKSAAVKAVLDVHGVTSRADELPIKHSWGERGDTDISRDVAAGLRASAVVPADTVKAEVNDHWITLTGDLYWNYQRETAGRLVEAIRGVAGVHNDVTLHPVHPVLPFATEHAKTAVKAALTRGALADSHDIDITVHGTRLELIGTVHSWHEFREASQAAWATPGVTDVQNNLIVAS